MKKRRIIIISIIALAVVGVGIWMLIRRREAAPGLVGGDASATPDAAGVTPAPGGGGGSGGSSSGSSVPGSATSFARRDSSFSSGTCLVNTREGTSIFRSPHYRAATWVTGLPVNTKMGQATGYDFADGEYWYTQFYINNGLSGERELGYAATARLASGSGCSTFSLFNPFSWFR